MQQDQKFNEYVLLFKKLNNQQKKKLVEGEFKKVLAFLEKIKLNEGIQKPILFNREILDMKSEFITDDDFVEAAFVYIHAIEESLGQYFNSISKKENL